jgi:hypothetical protein
MASEQQLLGNEAVRLRRFSEAVKLYTSHLDMFPKDHVALV